MKGNPQVIKALQAAAAQEAQLHLQQRLDHRSLKFMGVKKVSKKIQGMAESSHDFLRYVVERVLFLEGDPSYQIGKISEQSSVTTLLQNELALHMAIVQPYEAAVQTAMKALDDTSRNLFEHLLKWHQKQIGWLEQQLRLIQALGETEYIAEKL